MVKKLYFILITLLFLVLPANAQIRGHILDAETKDSIPLVSVIYKGHGISAISDINGHYKIARRNGWVLTFSAVGYVSQSVKITESTSDHVNIRLKPDNKRLDEVVIKTKKHKYSRKNNPAVELMKKVIEHKKQTDLSNRDFYQYNKYQKIMLALNDVNTDTLRSKRFQKHPWLKDQLERCDYTGKIILPISVDETVSQKIYRKHPHSEKTIIKGQNSTGINDLFQTGDIMTTVLKDVFTDVNIYDDQIRMLQYPFTSPIGKDAIAFYRFYIEDTTYVDKDKCIHLNFLPNNQQDFGFRGDIYIMADSSYQVKRCELTIPKKSDVNFVENLKVLQEFTQLPDSSWSLSVDDMVAELRFNKWLSRAAVIRTTRLTDYAFDDLPKQLFKGKAKEVKEADAQMRGDDFWNKYRQVELTKGEKGMGTFLSHIENLKGFKYIIFGAKAFIENFVETSAKDSKVDIGPINTMLTSNFIDGFRTRISAQSTANLNKHWFFSGYAARAWGSEKNYYSGSIIYSFNKKEYLPREFPRRTIAFTSSYDVTSPSDKFIHTDKDNVFTAWKWTTVDKMMFQNRQELKFEREEEWGFKTTISFKTEENEACGAMHYTTLAQQAVNPYNPHDYPHIWDGRGKYRTTELSLGVRIAPGETFINTKQRRLTINLDAPVFSINHVFGLKDVLGGDYRFNYTTLDIYKRFWMKSWGKIDCYIKSGIQWNQVPYPLLIMPAANLSYIIEDETFNLINNMEVLNDRFVSLDLSWDLNGKIFNRIPLLKKLKWREYIGIKALWGTLTDKNNPYLKENAGSDMLMVFPEGCYLMDKNKPYIELVAGIHNIFKILHVEYVRRMNYLELPTSNKQGIRFTFRMTF